MRSWQEGKGRGWGHAVRGRRRSGPALKLRPSGTGRGPTHQPSSEAAGSEAAPGKQGSAKSTCADARKAHSHIHGSELAVKVKSNVISETRSSSRFLRARIYSKNPKIRKNVITEIFTSIWWEPWRQAQWTRLCPLGLRESHRSSHKQVCKTAESGLRISCNRTTKWNNRLNK